MLRLMTPEKYVDERTREEGISDDSGSESGREDVVDIRHAVEGGCHDSEDRRECRSRGKCLRSGLTLCRRQLWYTS